MTATTFPRSLRRVALAAALFATATIALPAADAASPWSAPHVERIMGGPSRPGVAAWGLAYNPVTEEMVVGDYISNQVRRFSPEGTWLGDFSNPKGSTGGVASAVAVDPRDGSTYVAVTGDGRTSKDVRKYDAAGNFLYDVDLPGSITWLTVDDEGDLWAPEAFGGTRIREWRFDDATKTATALVSMGTAGSGPGQLKRLTGIEVDAAGNVYVCDPGNWKVHVFGPSGNWRFDIGNRTLFPGDMRGIAVDDAAGRLYVANSQAGTIEVFDLAGAHLTTIGSLGHADGQFLDGPRQLTVTPDGHVWGADYAARRVEEFTADGTFAGAFPSPPQPPDPAGLASARGVAVDRATGDVLVADNWNQRVQRFAPDGSLLKVFGERGSFPPAGMNYPRSIAVDPDTRNVWVANYEGDPDLMVFTPDFQKVMRIMTPRFVNDLEIVDGKAYALVRRTGSVMVFDATTGDLIRTCCTSFGFMRGIAVDTATGNLWLTSDSNSSVWVVNASGTLLRTLNVDNRPWGVTIVGDVVYVADSGANRVIAFDRTTFARLGQFGGKGFLPGQLIGPSGIDHDDAGNLYVVEDDGGRVQMFGWDLVPAPELVKPTIAWDAPAAMAPLTITGTAADASAVLQVEVQIQDPATGKYWNARTGMWGLFLWNRAIVWGPSPSPSWRFTFVPTVGGHAYTVKAHAIDGLGNVSKALTGSFSAG
jgi:DNA-binding beta-propeller fold protein YncE